LFGSAIVMRAEQLRGERLVIKKNGMKAQQTSMVMFRPWLGNAIPAWLPTYAGIPASSDAISNAGNARGISDGAIFRGRVASPCSESLAGRDGAKRGR